MIAFVRGTVTAVAADTAVLDIGGTAGGLGLQVRAGPGTLAELTVGETATLPTTLVVREDSLTLYGFADEDERQVFEQLQTASGVGPRLAQAMVAVLTPETIRTALAQEDLATLSRVPGVGKKVAQRLVLELRDRLGVPVPSGSPAAGTAGPAAARGQSWQAQVHAGLVGLGWSAKDADEAVSAVVPLAESTDGGESASVPELLRAALQTLSRA